MLQTYKPKKMWTNFSHLDAFGFGAGFRNQFANQFATQIGAQIERALSNASNASNAFNIGAINAPTPITMVRDEKKSKATQTSWDAETQTQTQDVHTQTTRTQTHNPDAIIRAQRNSEPEWEEDAVLVTVTYYVKSLVFTVPITSLAKTEIILMCKTLGSKCSVVFEDTSWIVNNDGTETRYDTDSEIGYFLHNVCDMYETFDEHMMSEAIGRCIVAVAHFDYITSQPM
jgi:hypothetical protein